MKIVIYSVILNNHQANIADELWRLTDGNFRFVELANMSGENRKGDVRNYDKCPYLIRAWQSETAYEEAMKLAESAECCVFSGVQALPFQKRRMAAGLLSFDMSERWLKRGMKNVLSPNILKMFLAYKLGRWSNKPLYKLCCSAFAADDHRKLGMYRGKCYKWGYFTQVDEEKILKRVQDASRLDIAPLMWCSRYLIWKHPELPITMAKRLKDAGYHFHLTMVGAGEHFDAAQALVKKLGVDDVVEFKSNIPNDKLLALMAEQEIFLFTSDRNEGWGAVSNESMANGCALIASDAIGATPYLVEDGVNGFSFKSPATTSGIGNVDEESLNDLCEKVKRLLDNREELFAMRQNALHKMQTEWSPRVAAERLLRLADALKEGRAEDLFENGPCSKA